MGKASRHKHERTLLREDTKRALLERVSARIGVPIPSDIRHTPPDQTSMANVLCELIEPWSRKDIDLEVYRELVRFGMLVWNGTFMPPAKAEELFSDLTGTPRRPEEKAVVREVIEAMTERKRQLFPDDRRLIMEVETRRMPDGRFDVAVVTMPLENVEDW